MPEFSEGDHVIYRPGRAFNWSGPDQDERGVVVLPAGHSMETGNGTVTAGPNYTFVRYGNDENAKATRTEDLVLENPTAVVADDLVVVGSWEVDESAFAATYPPNVVALPVPDETFVNAVTPTITTVVGEVGFHIDAQTRNALRQAFFAGVESGRRGVPPYAPRFDQWIEEYIEDHERITSD